MFLFVLKIVKKSLSWWTLQDSNLQPTGYEPGALTIELRVRYVIINYMKKDLYIFGEGGLGREVFDEVSQNTKFLEEFSLKGFVINNGLPFNPITRNINEISNKSSILIAIGDQKQRKFIFEHLTDLGFSSFPNFLSIKSSISSSIKLGKGNIILNGSILTVGIKLGDFNVINVSCTVGHDSNIQDFITISPRVSISGNCTINSLCFLGTASTLLPNVIIGENVTLGAGSVVLKKCEKNKTYVGVPAMKLD